LTSCARLKTIEFDRLSSVVVHHMGKVKIFLDHLLFSTVSVSVVLLTLSLLLSFVGTDFSVSKHGWYVLGLWLVLSVASATVLTVLSMRSRPPDRIEFTRRRH
jgi:threonine/homoserine/homoserine lactone efflux protein